MTTGRTSTRFRVLDPMQLTAKHKVATPVTGKHGDDVIIAGSVSDDDAKKLFQRLALASPIRIVGQPVMYWALFRPAEGDSSGSEVSRPGCAQAVDSRTASHRNCGRQEQRKSIIDA
jgi:hypothetical protein